MSDNNRIAKNTLFLYIRMILIMGVTLYTSRIVLNILGVEDYGLYNVVGGVVGLLSFLSGTLSIGTSRFITYELGTRDTKKLVETFSTSFYTHLALGGIMAVLLETGGLWFVYNKLVIPEARLDAALLVYHVSILTMVISVTQTPYTAAIMAHERMGIYAYISIFEVLAKLGIVYLLTISPVDKLITYAVLLAVVQILVAIFYRIYCIKRFKETHLHLFFNKSIFKQMMGFSGWNIIASLTEVLKLQGIIVLMNMFFAPAIVGAQAIANQVAGALMQFITGFITAVNPQIIKQYAVGKYEESKDLTLSAAFYSFILVLLLALPCILISKTLLDLWLVKVPDFAVVFVQWTLVQKIISTIDMIFYTPLMASGKIKKNSLSGIIFGFGQFVLLYILLKLGFGVMCVQYMGIMIISSFSFFVKPYLLHTEVSYQSKELILTLARCICVALLSVILSYNISLLFDKHSLINNLFIVICSILSILLSGYLFASQRDKKRLKVILVQRFK